MGMHASTRRNVIWLSLVCILGLIVVVGDRAILQAINPQSPVPFLDKFFNIYTDICGAAMGLVCMVFILSFLARSLRPRGWRGYPGLSALVFWGLLCMGLPKEGGERIALFIVPPIFLLLGWVLSKKQTPGWKTAEKVALASLIAVAIGGGFVTQAMKDWVKRPRPLNPANTLTQKLRGFPEEQLIGFQSFPSGHSSAAWSLCFPAFLALRGRKKRYVFLTLPFLTSLSRVYLAVHFPTDVYTGAVLGMTAGYLGSFAIFGPGLGAPQTEVERTSA